MSREPRLTIVIPTLNRAALVERAVRSALAQTSTEIEIIVSDNGSTDSTQQVLAGLEDPRLRKFRREETVSASEHGNFLIDQARGEFFLGLSDDDFLEPDFAARVLDAFDARPGLAFAYSRCWVHYGEIAVPSLPAPGVESGRAFLRHFFAGAREVCWCACVTRTASLRRNGPIPQGRIFGDMYHWTRIAFEGDVGCVPSLSSHYTFMGDNLSSAVPVTAWSAETRLLADETLGRFVAGGSTVEEIERLRRDSANFVARSTANQFFWNALRGVGRRRLWAELRAGWSVLRRHPLTWPRVLAAFALGPPQLRRLILASARHRALRRHPAQLVAD